MHTVMIRKHMNDVNNNDIIHLNGELRRLFVHQLNSAVSSEARVQDKSIQCDLNKYKRHHPKSEFKVIKANPRDGSVSVYSNVSLIGTDDQVRRTRARDVIHSSPRDEGEYRLSSHRNIAHETIEETISISNASTDELMDREARTFSRAPSKETSNGRTRRYPRDEWMNDFDTQPKSTRVISGRHTHDGRHFHSLSRISDRHHRDRSLESSNRSCSGSGGSPLWFSKPVDVDYRKCLHSSRVNVIRDDDLPFHSITLSRGTHRDAVERKSTDAVHAYTLDRRHFDRKKRTPLNCQQLDSGVRRFASTRDITHCHPECTDYRRGGLAAAFRQRQARAASLNTSIEREHHASSVSLASMHREPDEWTRERARTRSLYHTEYRAPVDEAPAHHSLSRKKHQRSATGTVTFASQSGQCAAAPSDDREKKGRHLARSLSIPKDTKFPWFTRLKMKVTNREP